MKASGMASKNNLQAGKRSLLLNDQFMQELVDELGVRLASTLFHHRAEQRVEGLVVSGFVVVDWAWIFVDRLLAPNLHLAFVEIA